MEANKRKKIIKRIAAVLLTVLILCTFASRTVQNILRPTVITAQAQSGTITFRKPDIAGEIIYPKMKDYKAAGNWKISEPLVKEGQKVKQGDPLFEVEIEGYERERLGFELELWQLERRLAASSGDERELLSRQLEILRLDYGSFTGKLPRNGLFRAPIDGYISFIAEDFAAEGQTAVSIIPPQTGAFAQWYLTAAEAAPYDDEAYITLQYYSDGRQQTVRSYVWVREQEGAYFRFTASLETDNAQLDGQNVWITMSQPSPTYQFVAPESAIFTTENGPAVFIKKTRKGLFGTEAYVEAAPVRILKSNGGKVAFECDKLFWTNDLVIAASKTPMDGMAVALVNS